MNIYDPIIGKLDEYYRMNEKAGSNSQKVGWKNEEAQTIRFRQLISGVGDEIDLTVNDLGCGLGDIYFYLKERFPEKKIIYCGYDISAYMIDGAASRLSGHNNCTVLKINDADDMNIADYTFASGIFNLSYGIGEDKWMNYILETIETMNKKSRKAFAFNALTKYSDPEYMKKELFYSDPCFLFDYCIRNISRNIALLHNYRQYDFTIIVNK